MTKKQGNKLNMVDGNNTLLQNPWNFVETYRALYENAAVAILVLKDGVYVDCNRMTEELLGISKAEVIGKTPFSFSPKFQLDGIESEVRIEQILNQVYSSDTPVSFEWLNVRFDNTFFISRVNLNKIDISGQIYILVFISDVTEYKRSINELDLHKNYLEGVVAERNREQMELNQKLSLTVEELNATNSELEYINKELNTTIKNLNREVHVRKELHDLLLQNQEKFRSFIDQSSDGVAIVDIEGRIIEWNNSMFQITGVSHSLAVKSSIFELNFQLLPDSKRGDDNIQYIKNQISQYITNAQNQQVLRIEGEIQLQTSESKFISSVFFPIRLTKGYLIGILTRDITKQKIVEGELKQHKEHLEELVKQKSNEILTISGLYQKIFNHTSDAIAIISEDLRLVEANPALQRMLGETDEELYSGHIFDSIPATYHTIIKNSVELLFSGKSINPLEIEIQSKDGTRIPVELSANIIEYNNSVALLSIIRDISDRRQMEKMILLTTIEAEERERRRLAADLHDDIGPLLASLKMYVSVLQQRLLNTAHSEVLEIVQNLIKSSIENVRTISNNISPHLIERFGLIPAVKAEIENVKMLIEIDFKTNSSSYKFDKQVEIIVYRIIKELLNNTLKYANATKIVLSINYHKSKLYLKYSDNGCGFSLGTTVLDKMSGHGLPNIDNRIKSINGNYIIETSPGNGFIFILDVPVNLR